MFHATIILIASLEVVASKCLEHQHNHTVVFTDRIDDAKCSNNAHSIAHLHFLHVASLNLSQALLLPYANVTNIRVVDSAVKVSNDGWVTADSSIESVVLNNVSIEDSLHWSQVAGQIVSFFLYLKTLKFF